MSTPPGAGGGIPAPPPPPADYVSETDWKKWVTNVQDTPLKSHTMTAAVYEKNSRYHFTLQPKWISEKIIEQPHITLVISEHEKYSYYWSDGKYNTTRRTADDNNPVSRPRFVAAGLDCEALLSAFCTAAEGKKRRFLQSREYDQQLAEYKKKYPWSNTLDAWTAAQKRDGKARKVFRKDADSVVVVKQAGALEPRVAAISKLRGKVDEPRLTEYSFEYLDATWCVLLDGSDTRYIRLGDLKETGSGKQQAALNGALWAQQVREKVPDAIEAKAVPGHATGDRIVFTHGGKLSAVATAESRPSVAFETDVHQVIDHEMSTIVRSEPVDDVWFTTKASEAVGKATVKTVLVNASSTIWAVPTGAIKVATVADRDATLPVYQIVDKYEFDETQVILQKEGGEHYLAIQKEVTSLLGDSDMTGMMLKNRSGNSAKAVRLPAMAPVDYLRYSWLKTMPKVDPADWGAIKLIVLSASECLVISDENQYKAGVAIGTAGCVRFLHSNGTDWLAVCPATCADKVAIVSPVGTLLNGSHVLVNQTNELMLCPAGRLSALAAGPTTVAVNVGGNIAGLVDLAALAPVTLDALVTAGALGPRVEVALDQESMSLVRQDPATGRVTRYRQQALILGPLKAAQADLLNLIIAQPGELLAATGVGNLAGSDMVVEPAGEVELYPAFARYWPTDSECIYSYGADNPEWTGSGWATVSADFISQPCDLILTSADGAFAGYANSQTAQDAWTAVLLDRVTAYGSAGTCQRVRARLLLDAGPADTESDYDVLMPANADVDSAFTADVVRVGPTLTEYIADPDAWLAATSAETGELTLCAYTNPPQQVLVGQLAEVEMPADDDGEDDDSDDGYYTAEDQ